VQPVPYDKLADKNIGETSADIRARVILARKIQEIRFKGIEGIHSNSQLTPKLEKMHCKIDAAGEALMKNAMEKLGLSARSYGRIFKVARTIADLEASPNIEAYHIAEAIQYRSLDRDGWTG
jgi:magnesium chelatase family protein